jgi:hypothetical protein
MDPCRLLHGTRVVYAHVVRFTEDNCEIKYEFLCIAGDDINSTNNGVRVANGSDTDG